VNVRISLIATFLLPLISGCSILPKWGSDVKPIEVKTVAVEKTRLNLKDPPPLEARDVQWIVITPENTETVFQKLRDENIDVVLIGLTDVGYEQLSLTMAEIKNYIAQQKAIIVKYKEYYEPAKPEEKK
jgi:hypothetical protein